MEYFFFKNVKKNIWENEGGSKKERKTQMKGEKEEEEKMWKREERQNLPTEKRYLIDYIPYRESTFSNASWLLSCKTKEPMAS